MTAKSQTVIYGLGTLVKDVAPNFYYPPGGVAGDQGLAAFDPAFGSPVAFPIRITGLVGNQKLVGIDFRPLTGQLYALGYDPALATGNAQLYTLDPKTAVAVAVSATPITLALGDATERIGFDFNPVADLARVVSSNDANYRVSPVTGLVVTTSRVDGPLAYAAGDPNAGLNPRVGGAAYTNPFAGATSTILYDAENKDDATAPSGILSTQSPPNDGTLNTQAPIRLGSGSGSGSAFYGIDAAARINIDIFWAGTYNKGYLLELTAPNGSGLSSSNLYDLSLPASATSPSDPSNPNTVGYGSRKRTLVPAVSNTPFSLLSIAVAPTPTIISLVPPSAEVNTPGLTLTVNGTGFVNGTTVQFKGSDRTTTYVSATQLTAVLTTADLATEGIYNVTVTNPPFPGTPSAPATFRVTQPCAAPTNLAASNITSTSATVSFTGNTSATSYNVTIAPGTATQTLPGTATSASFTGLMPNTSYTVSITTTCPSGTTGPATVTFTTSVAAATLAVSQGGTSYPSGGTAYSFGNQTLNTTSPAVAFTLTNGGTDPLTIGSITTTGDYAVSGTAPTTVPAGGTATVNVTFTPTLTGTRNGTLVINSNATNGAAYTVNLTGTGQPATPNPQIAVSQGGTGITNGGTFMGFASTQQGSTSAPVSFTISNGSTTDALTLGAFTFTGPYALSGAAPTSVAPGGTATFSVTFSPTAVGPNTGSVSIANNSQTNNPYVINFSGQGTSQDLLVSSPQLVQGSYRNVTIQGPNGVATLSGTLTVSGTLAVQSGGSLIQNCQLITGGGNFDLQAGGAIAICDAAGIATSGAVGAVQVSGTRTFSPQASYLYNGTVAQVTGSGLPAQVLNLGVLNTANVTLSQAVAVAGVVRLQSGNLNTGGQMLTLLSSAAGTALVDNSGGAVNGTATVQRYIDPSLNAGRGYRHYSSPVANSTVADLSTATFTPVVNPQYNSVGSSVTLFPTVFGFEESRITTSGNSPRTVDFDKGYFSPTTLGDALEVTRGYTVNIPGTETVDFVGTLNNGPLTTPTLTRGAQTESGWQLRGNPYPSPLDWSKVIAAGRATNIENALYVFKSTGQYAGNYTSYVNGQTTNSGTNVLPLGQGFFVRVLAGQTTGSISFANADRLTTPNSTPFQRGTADSRTQLTLVLSNGTNRTQTVMYFEAGATTSFDRAFDARSLGAPSGLLLATETPTAEQLSINGQPLLTGADVLLPLQLAASAAGTYTLAVDNLANLPNGYRAYLRDGLTGTYTDLGTTPSISLNLTANASAGGRYAVLFSNQPRALATAPAALAQLASVYPNPAHGTATLLLPMALRGTAATTVSVVDNLGRTVLTRTLAAGSAETLELPLNGLATGVYSVQARTAVGLVAKRLVVQ
ncbi:DUF4394 domain-containing protein [Hymenobacter sp. DH14]|uniref:DUF4394 domain-containing protein n=1 Tax=Hymenobacter cyanobacteriorum TaxID=2926463 RepID=A0A9X1VDZ0_9BACT|nr:DUF4394 domain-containing protein [Hymenobacter cyanobacteriorum]MCI1186348.1 DUF4394 domain-containing protein [Hymenobacter cyanobacteriorum]